MSFNKLKQCNFSKIGIKVQTEFSVFAETKCKDELVYSFPVCDWLATQTRLSFGSSVILQTDDCCMCIASDLLAGCTWFLKILKGYVIILIDFIFAVVVCMFTMFRRLCYADMLSWKEGRFICILDKICIFNVTIMREI